GFTRLVLKKAGDLLPTLQRENLQKVERSAVNLLAIINDVLDLSKIEAGRLDLIAETFSLRDVIDDVVTCATPLIGDKPLKLEVKMAQLPEMVTDRTRVRQVVINLASNAIKFTNEGSVTIAVAYDPASDVVEIAVADTGIGIPKADQATVF